MSAVRQGRVVIIGVLLCVGGALAAWLLLRAQPPPSEAPPAVFFVTDDRPKPLAGTPFAPLWSRPSLDVIVGGQPSLIGDCNPVSVTVRAHVTDRLLGAFRRRTQFVLVVSGVVTDVHARIVGSSSPRPDLHRVTAIYPELETNGFPEASVNARPARRVDVQGPGNTKVTTTLLQGDVPYWPLHRGDLEFTFRAEWAQRRNAGACFWRLPRILGDFRPWEVPVPIGTFHQKLTESFGVGQIAGLPDHIVNPASGGRSHAVVTAGRLSRAQEDLIPQPDDLEHLSYGCEVRRVDGKDVRADDRDCHGIVVAESANLANNRLFYLFLLAAVVSLGLQMLYEAATGRRERKEPPTQPF